MKEGLNIQYLINFYSYLFAEKAKRLTVFLLTIFFASLLPYIIVAFSLDYSNSNQMKSFYGDGSILTLCTGILLSYYTVFLEFRENKGRNDDEKKNISDDNRLITVSLLIVYAVVLVQFYLCQTTARDMIMILQVVIGSILLFLLTLIVSSYLHFREEVSFADVQSHEDKRRIQKLKRSSEKTVKTEDGMKL